MTRVRFPVGWGCDQVISGVVGDELTEAILSAAAPSLHIPISHSVHYAACLAVDGKFTPGQVHDRIVELIRAGALVLDAGRVVARVRVPRPEHVACRTRTEEEDECLTALTGSRECPAATC